MESNDYRADTASCPNCGKSENILISQTAALNTIACKTCGYALGMNTSFIYLQSEWNRLSIARDKLFERPLIFYKQKKTIQKDN